MAAVHLHVICIYYYNITVFHEELSIRHSLEKPMSAITVIIIMTGINFVAISEYI